MMKSKKLVFFGTEKFSTYALETLLNEGWDVVAVVTKPDAPSGRGRQMHLPLVKEIATRHSIEVFQPENQIDLIALSKKLDTDIAVLSAYGKIIPKEILEHFGLGIVNIHPSLLPKHRGASPIEQTILDDDQVTGVSLMKLVEKMDAGPVFAQEKLTLKGDETAAELYDKLGKLGASLLIDKLPAIVVGELKPVVQNEPDATYAPMIKKSDGIIDWNDEAKVVERRIRAYSQWPGSKMALSNKQVTLTKATAGNDSGKPGVAFENDGLLGVYCKNGSITIEKLKPDGKREMTAKEFLAGNKLLA